MKGLAVVLACCSYSSKTALAQTLGLDACVKLLRDVVLHALCCNSVPKIRKIGSNSSTGILIGRSEARRKNELDHCNVEVQWLGSGVNGMDVVWFVVVDVVVVAVVVAAVVVLGLGMDLVGSVSGLDTDDDDDEEDVKSFTEGCASIPPPEFKAASAFRCFLLKRLLFVFDSTDDPSLSFDVREEEEVEEEFDEDDEDVTSFTEGCASSPPPEDKAAFAFAFRSLAAFRFLACLDVPSP